MKHCSGFIDKIYSLINTNKNKQTMYGRIEDISKLFEQEDDDDIIHQKTGWSDLSDLWNNNYLEYESDGTRSKVYHQKITPN